MRGRNLCVGVRCKRKTINFVTCKLRRNNVSRPRTYMPPKRRWTSSEKRSVGARQEWKCARCGVLLPATFEVDHVQALHKGGADCVKTNAEALCNKCHSRKTLDERIQLERLRTNAILKAKAEAAASGTAPLQTSTSTFRPLLGNRPVLTPEPGHEVLENQFLKFAHVVSNGRHRQFLPI